MRRITNKSNQQLQRQKFEEFLEKSWTNKYIYTYTLTHTHEWKMELIWILKEEKRGTRWNKREREWETESEILVVAIRVHTNVVNACMISCLPLDFSTRNYVVFI